MSAQRTIGVALGVTAVATLVVAAVFWREAWLPMFTGARAHHADDAAPAAPIEVQQAKLSPQARKNLKLVSQPLQVQDYWRTVQIPGTIVDRPGVSDRGVPAPVTGVVVKVHRFPGDIVRPGDPLVTLR